MEDVTPKLLLFPSSTNKGISKTSQRKVSESLVQYLLQQREAKLDKRIQKTNKPQQHNGVVLAT